MGRSVRYERERLALEMRLVAQGWTAEDAAAIHRDAIACDRWAVEECNGTVEDLAAPDPVTGEPPKAPQWHRALGIDGPGPTRYVRTRPYGPQAEARIRRIVDKHPAFGLRLNGDPRGRVVSIGFPGYDGDESSDRGWVGVPVPSEYATT
jgi:hypothetical protein